MKTLFFSHGDKGGVGKSVISTLAIEYLLNRGRVALVETDPRQPDVAVRYKEDPDVTIVTSSLNRAGDSENALTKFGLWLEQEAPEQVVVNLPSGAGETIDQHSELIRTLADQIGYRLVAVYALEKGPVATAVMIESLKNGLLSVVDKENRFVAYPLYKGDPEIFEWYKSKERKEGLIGEITIPALRSTAALSRLEATTGRLSALTAFDLMPPGWMIVEQASVRGWYKSGLSAIKPIFEEE
jgi:hypothetical protein